jgi:predicted transcriptional regulator
MYKANLSHRQLEKYLDFLLSQGLIEEAVDEECGRTNYRVSQRGIVFLKDYARLSTYLEAEEK